MSAEHACETCAEVAFERDQATSAFEAHHEALRAITESKRVADARRIAFAALRGEWSAR